MTLQMMAAIGLLHGRVKTYRRIKGKSTLVQYHPFDKRVTCFTGITSGFMAYPRMPLMGNMLHKNVALLLVRNSRRGNVNNVFVADTIVDKDGVSPFDNVKVFPLYLYSDDGTTRSPNLDAVVVEKIASGIGLKFIPETTDEDGTFSPLDLLDYIYAVLHTPSYREKFKEFLKIELSPRAVSLRRRSVPQTGLYWRGVRSLHLMESPKLSKHGHHLPGRLATISWRRWPIQGRQGLDEQDPVRWQTCRKRSGTSTSAATSPRRNGSRIARAEPSFLRRHSPLPENPCRPRRNPSPDVQTGFHGIRVR